MEWNEGSTLAISTIPVYNVLVATKKIVKSEYCLAEMRFFGVNWQTLLFVLDSIPFGSVAAFSRNVQSLLK